MCGVGPIPDESIVVDPKTKGVANGFAYVVNPSGTNPEAEKALLAKAPEVVVDQKGCRFVPHVVALHKGQTLVFTSGDPVPHNVNYTTVRQGGQNQMVPTGGRLPVKFAAGERHPTQFACNIHGWMNGWFMVFDHPFFALTKPDGSFEIAGVPAGPAASDRPPGVARVRDGRRVEGGGGRRRAGEGDRRRRRGARAEKVTGSGPRPSDRSRSISTARRRRPVRRRPMSDEDKIDPGHDGVRRALRVVGPLVALVGLGFTAVGMISFFSSFGTFEFPRYFWCAFVGLPLLAVGGAISQMAYLGSIARYVAGEAAPVGKDTFNYMARGTAPAARDFAREVSRGVAEGLGGVGDESRVAFCPKCGAETPSAARFCSRCGVQLATTGEDLA